MSTDVEDVSDPRAVLSALLDRERVDPDELARVLEDAEARALLVDFVRLRHEFSAEADGRTESPGANVAAAEHVAGASSARRRSPVARWLRPLAAALLLTAAGAGGMWLGEQRREDRPPQPSRVVSFTPGVDWKEKP
jgi:hypothetical protein